MTTLTGILPAAGKADRLSGLPKFLLPIERGHLLGYHIDMMWKAGASAVWVGAGKHNSAFVKPYVDDRITVNNRLDSASMSETVLAARSLAGDGQVIFSMPDTYWHAADVFGRLLYRLNHFNADVAVAVWRMRLDQRGRLGCVDWWQDRLTRVVEKDPACGLDYAWGAIAWTAPFWSFVQPDRALGISLDAAAHAGMKVMVVQIEDEYHDCGTRDGYFRLCAQFAREYA